MPDPISPFSSPVFPVGVRRLAAHPNPALALLVGRTGPVTVEDEDGQVTGDALIVRPGITHHVSFAARGADVIYLNGLAFRSAHRWRSRPRACSLNWRRV